MDVARDGIALYEYDDKSLHQPKPKTPEQALAMAREYFEEWYPSATALLEGTEFYRGKGRLKEAAFSLHQATERLVVATECASFAPARSFQTTFNFAGANETVYKSNQWKKP